MGSPQQLHLQGEMLNISICLRGGFSVKGNHCYVFTRSRPYSTVGGLHNLGQMTEQFNDYCNREAGKKIFNTRDKIASCKGAMSFHSSTKISCKYAGRHLYSEINV